MLFNSFAYLVFFPLVFILYWLFTSKNVKIQNVFLLAASYFFYAWWDWRYLSLIILCSGVNYSAGILLMKTNIQKYRRLIIYVCCIVSLGVLGVFKYYDFFITSFADLLGSLNINLHLRTLNLILPVGISFYTFHTLTYTLEVYKGKFTSTKDIVSFFLFVSIFPLAMAGPIERATNLLPQLYKKRIINYAEITAGLKMILWGFFMKVAIADRLSIYVDAVYNNVPNHSGSSLMLATIFFSFQIYCDFAGYSSIAIGCGKLLGFNFIKNFNRPYLAVSVADFWKRWHISLSTWFRDYVYIPLGGNRCSPTRNYYNLMVTFLVSGLWHGANWTFVVWGGLNGLYQIIGKLFTSIKGKFRKKLSFPEKGKIKIVFNVITTFILISFTWIFFRANSMNEAFLIIKKIYQFEGTLFTTKIGYGVILVLILIISDILQERNSGVHFFLDNKHRVIRYITYLTLVLIILLIGVFDGSQFIYFQF